MPHFALDRLGRRHPWIWPDEYHFPTVAEGAAKVARAGGNVSLGAHGQLQGLGVHWELWAHGRRGRRARPARRMTPHRGAARGDPGRRGQDRLRSRPGLGRGRQAAPTSSCSTPIRWPTSTTPRRSAGWSRTARSTTPPRSRSSGRRSRSCRGFSGGMRRAPLRDRHQSKRLAPECIRRETAEETLRCARRTLGAGSARRSGERLSYGLRAQRV